MVTRSPGEENINKYEKTKDIVIKSATENNTEILGENKNTTDITKVKNLQKKSNSVEKDLEEITIPATLEKSDGIINEINILQPAESSGIVTLKKPNEVYMEIYQEARKKAKQAKSTAIHAYLEAKRIKSLYLLNDIESSDDDLEFGEI